MRPPSPYRARHLLLARARNHHRLSYLTRDLITTGYTSSPDRICVHERAYGLQRDMAKFPM